MSVVLGRTRDTLVLAAALLVIALTLGASSAWALPDYDGDGFTGAADCDPLDGSIAPGKPDKPDLAFKDSNCDGVDGDLSKAIFVSTSGAPGNTGTGSKENPYSTIGFGIAKAKADGKDVYITGGTYNEMLQLDDNVGLYGGYRPVTGVRSMSEPTVIDGTNASPQAAVADGDTGVVLQLLTLKGRPDAARNAYGLRAVNTSSIVLNGVTALAADAVGGPAGAPGGTGGNGGNGGNGNPWAQGTSPGGTRGSGTNQGGLGGKGNQGASGDPGANGAGGTLGGAFGGGGSLSPGPIFGANGTSGFPGSNGTPAGGGPAPAAGVIFGSATATAGNAGTAGGGGGGGGAGAGNPNACGFSGYSWSGATGGGGGGGGNPGGLGQGGTSGGGSFGVYVHNSVVTSDGSTLTGGKGGNGGNGGAGGAGGGGGFGGIGYKDNFTQSGCSLGNGGDGGPGGQGGSGGGGGGGQGGWAAGILKAGTGSFVLKQTNATAGTPGSGGLAGGTSSRATNGSAAGALPNATSDANADFDADGIKDVNDSCVATPRGGSDANGDGCPDEPSKLADSDGDGIPDNADACAGTPRGGVDANEDGCPDSTGGGGGTGGGSTGGGGGAQQVDPTQILIAWPFAFSKSTKKFTVFTVLQIKAIPIGSTLKVVCKAPKGKKCPGGKSFTKRNAFGTVNLKKWVKKRIPAGTKMTATVTKPGNYIGAVKIMTVQKKKRPKFTDRCLPPGSSRPVGC